MKLHADKPDQIAVTAYGDGWIAVNGQRHERSLVLDSAGGVHLWDAGRLEDLSTRHFEDVLALASAKPELLLLGSGARLRFVSPAHLRPLIERGIGVETMDTAAACRTFNILAGEGRQVLAALLLEPS